jgi:phosphatidylserine/phosphatidylglycerophosphate/cardiolipin synthase-like enzyme
VSLYIAKHPDVGLERLPAKLYIVDEEVALAGSANLTYSGMNRNIERLEVKTSTSEIGQEIEAFLDLWGSERTK